MKIERHTMIRTTLACAALGLVLAAAPASAVFTEVALAAGVQFDQFADPTIPYGGGIVWADFNNDGWEDFFGVQAMGCNVLFLNDGDGTFSPVANAAGADACGVVGRGATAADLDNDGDQDLFLGNLGQNALYRNLLVETGSLAFTDVTIFAGMDNDGGYNTSSSVLGDFDNDGFLDLFVGNHTSVMMPATICEPNNLWHNQGDGTFVDVAPLYGIDQDGDANAEGCALAATFTDIDGDMDQDLMVVNDLGPVHVPNRLYRNDGPGIVPGEWTWEDISEESGFDFVMYAMGIAISDYDFDGDFDYYIADIGANEFARNNGDGTFTDIAAQAGVEASDQGQYGGDGLVSWGPVFIDIDHDGFEDLFVANGGSPEEIFPGMFGADYVDNNPNYAYRNNADGTFTEVHDVVLMNSEGYHRNITYVDFDRDGDIDLHAGVHHGPNTLYRNDNASGGAWLQVEAEGTIGNRDGVGALVELYAAPVPQLREIDGGSTMLSLSSRIAHFGLGPATMVDRLVVTFLSGLVVENRDIAVNQLVQVVEPVYLTGTSVDEITVSPGGGFSLDLSVENLLDTTESFETWVDLKFPDDTVRTVLGPLPTTLGPGDEIVAPISPTVPLNASLGDYEIILRAGSYPIDVIHQSFVDVTIE